MWRNVTSSPLELFVQKWQPKVGLVGYDIPFAYLVVEAKSKTTGKPIELITCFSLILLKVSFRQNSYNICTK